MEESLTKATDQDDAQPVVFADLGLDARVLKGLQALGWEAPSPIQAQTIPPLLDGFDVIGLAQTGTGKTAAFALPILSHLDNKPGKPQALIMAPTRELALQVAEAFESLGSHLPKLHVLPIYGGQSYGVQLSALKRGVHVVVGTPGRIIDHIEKGTLDLSEIRYLVLDEADEMLRMGFVEDVERIMEETPEDKQVALFSATMPAPIKRITKKYLKDPVEIAVKGKTKTLSTTSQRFLVVSYMQKLDALTRILEVEDFDAMIVFARTKQDTETIAEKLRARGFSAAAINGDMVQAQRERTVNHLKDGKLDILVATDVAARGLDVDRISHVVNFDLPLDPESYVHRIGRTGRAGREGKAISFVTPREKRLQGTIEKSTKQPMTQMQLPSADKVNDARISKFHDAISEALKSDQLEEFRALVTRYEETNDTTAEDIAAALAVMAHDGRSLLLEDQPEPMRKPRRDRDDRPERGERSERFERRGDRGDRDERRGGGRFDRGERRGRRDEDFGGNREDRRSREFDRSDRGGSRRFTPYRIAVGRRHKIMPRHIVGAIANEAGLSRDDFGRIDIQVDHSIVELPVNLDRRSLQLLEATRISGKLIEIRPYQERAPRKDRREY